MQNEKLEQPTQAKDSTDTNEAMSLAEVLFRAIIPMKVAVLYFGSKMTEDPSQKNIVLFALSIIISFGSLIYYAAKKHRENPN